MSNHGRRNATDTLCFSVSYLDHCRNLPTKFRLAFRFPKPSSTASPQDHPATSKYYPKCPVFFYDTTINNLWNPILLDSLFNEIHFSTISQCHRLFLASSFNEVYQVRVLCPLSCTWHPGFNYFCTNIWRWRCPKYFTARLEVGTRLRGAHECEKLCSSGPRPPRHSAPTGTSTLCRRSHRTGRVRPT